MEIENKEIKIKLSVELLVEWRINIFDSIRRATYERELFLYHLCVSRTIVILLKVCGAGKI
jgi:hypothetical protein